MPCDERVDEDADEDRFVRLVLASLAVDGVGVEIMVHWGSAMVGLNGLASRSRVYEKLCPSSEMLCGESRMRADSSGPKRKVEVEKLREQQQQSRRPQPSQQQPQTVITSTFRFGPEESALILDGRRW